MIFNNIGISYADKKDFEEALRWYCKDLEIEKRFFGER
jgi:hypothetical protein